MNKGTLIRTILVIATCFNTALMATDVAQFGNDKVNAEYKAWEEKKKSFRMMLFDAMREADDIDFGKLYQALEDFDKRYPCPIQ